MSHSVSLVKLTDQKVFEQLFNEHYASLCAFAFHYTEDHQVAEDIVQDVFSTLWENADKVEIRTNLKSYLLGAVRNAALNYLKHSKIVDRYQQEEKTTPAPALSHDFLEFEELHEQIEQALDQLPPKCREVFEMSRVEEMKYSEIAKNLDISIKTVETQISRALKVMRQVLGHYIKTIIF